MSESSYGAGYVAGMLDVTVEYERTVRQVDEDGTVQRVVLREGWQEVLHELVSGPQLPSELARRLGRDRSSITRILRQMRAAGLAQGTNDAYDGRARPHRLTARGRRMVVESKSAISSDIERGIAIAVHLFQHMLDHEACPASALGTLAEAILGDSEAASAAVSKWAAESEEAGILSSRWDADSGDERYRATPRATPVLAERSAFLWQSVSSVLHKHREYRRESVPIYVRTGEEGWAAWAHALHSDNDARGSSRTIVDGDLVSGAVAPPPERFDLLYDDPAVIGADLHEPTMQAFMEQADAKFVVTNTESDVPDGFIPLTLDMSVEAQ